MLFFSQEKELLISNGMSYTQIPGLSNIPDAYTTFVVSQASDSFNTNVYTQLPPSSVPSLYQTLANIEAYSQEPSQPPSSLAYTQPVSSYQNGGDAYTICNDLPLQSFGYSYTTGQSSYSFTTR